MSEPMYVSQANLDHLERTSNGLLTREFLENGLGMDIRLIEPITKSPWEEYLEQQRKVADVPKVSRLRGFSHQPYTAIFDEAVSFVEAGNGPTDKEESLATLERLGFRPGALCCRLARGGI